MAGLSGHPQQAHVHKHEACITCECTDWSHKAAPTVTLNPAQYKQPNPVSSPSSLWWRPTSGKYLHICNGNPSDSCPLDGQAPKSHPPASFTGAQKHTETLPLNSQAGSLSWSAAKPVWYWMTGAHWHTNPLPPWVLVPGHMTHGPAPAPDTYTPLPTEENNSKWSWVRSQDRMCWWSAGHGHTSTQTNSLPEVPHFFDGLLGFYTSTTPLYPSVQREETHHCVLFPMLNKQLVNCLKPARQFLAWFIFPCIYSLHLIRQTTCTNQRWKGLIL